MKLRTRVIIIALLALAFFAASFYLLTSMTIDRTYARADTQSAQREVARARSYLSAALDSLGGTCSDWAYWDDTYQFAADRNTRYMDSNLAPESLKTININTMILLDTSGKKVFAVSSEPKDNAFNTTSQEIITHFASGTALLAQALAYPGVTGYVLVGNEPMLAAAQPVLTSARTGPARGTLIFVRRLDQVFFSTMSATIGGDVALLPTSQVQPDTIESQALALLTDEQPSVGLLAGAREVRGFERLSDLPGRASLLLATTEARTKSNEINRLKLVVVAMTGLIGLMLTFFATLFMTRTVVSRIAELGKQVAQVGRTSDLSLRVHARGSDEISRLADDVNTTLESLQQTQMDKDRMAQELEQDRKRLHDYFDHAHDLIFALDTHGRLTLINQSACSVLGYEERDLLGRSALDFVSPTSRDFALRASGAIESGDTVATTTIDVLTGNGDHRTLEVSGQRLFSNSQLTGTFYIARDVTDRLRMDHEMLRNQALESLGALAAGIAHDFNNVLTVVKGNLSLADLSADDPTELRRYVEVARLAADRAQALASQLLTFSRGGAPAKENVDVEAIVREVARFALSGSNVALRMNVDGPLAAVEADPNQLFQIIQNIILNARDAMLTGGTLTITIYRQTISEEQPFGLAAPGACVVIEIVDTGPGIAPEDMKRLFDPFFTTKPSGHGLGLATARSVARRHEGDLIVESTQGEGTTVRLCVPIAQGPASLTELTETATIPGITTGRVLVMDDERTVADVTCAMARRLGYEATAVADGGAALTAYEQAMTEQRPFDLVIMDLTIPGGMGGHEAVQRLLELHPDARVIVASGYSDDASIADYARCGFIASLAKPYTLQDLQRVLREASKPKPPEA